MKCYYVLATLLGIVASVLAENQAEVPTPVRPFLAKRSLPTTSEYDATTSVLAQDGICRSFFKYAPGKTGRGDPIDMCRVKCPLKEGQSVSCFLFIPAGSPPQPVFYDPDGSAYHMAKCKCDIPFADIIVNDVLMALPMIAEIGCAILFGALNLVLEIGALAIPGEGELMDAGMMAATKAAKTISENGQDAMSFFQWFKPPCGNGPGVQAVNKIFDPLSNVPDNVVTGNGCKKKPCPGKKKPDPSAPKSEDVPKTDDPKTDDPGTKTDRPSDSTDHPSTTQEATSTNSPSSNQASTTGQSTNPSSTITTPRSTSTSDHESTTSHSSRNHTMRSTGTGTGYGTGTGLGGHHVNETSTYHRPTTLQTHGTKTHHEKPGKPKKTKRFFANVLG